MFLRLHGHLVDKYITHAARLRNTTQRKILDAENKVTFLLIRLTYFLLEIAKLIVNRSPVVEEIFEEFDTQTNVLGAGGCSNAVH